VHPGAEGGAVVGKPRALAERLSDGSDDGHHQPLAERNHQPLAERHHQPLAERHHQPLAERHHQPLAERHHQPLAERDPFLGARGGRAVAGAVAGASTEGSMRRPRDFELAADLAAEIPFAPCGEGWSLAPGASCELRLRMQVSVVNCL
jgi:hypothetical protein